MNKKIFGIFLLGVIFLLLGGCGSTVSSGLGASSTVTGAGDFVWSSVFLTSIDISTGTIDPSFSKETTTYTVQVPNTVDHVTVTPAAEDPYAQINLAGQTLISGEESNQINLVVGVPKTIEIKITSRTSTDEKTYTVIVTRIPSNDANLSGLTVNGAAITPTIFDKDTIIYSATVLSTTTSITLTPVLEDLTASLRVNTLSANSGDTVPVVLAAGLNIINTVVTAQNGDQKIYTVVITRGNSEANLSSLEMIDTNMGMIDFNPVFAQNIPNYSAQLDTSVNSVSITPVALDPYAEIKINGVVVASGSQSNYIDMVSGDNTITIQVISSDLSTWKFYTITVAKP